jgi:hypothetical protein
MQLNFGAALPWLVGFVFLLVIYLYVRSNRIKKSRRR